MGWGPKIESAAVLSGNLFFKRSLQKWLIPELHCYSSESESEIESARKGAEKLLSIDFFLSSCAQAATICWNFDRNFFWKKVKVYFLLNFEDMCFCVSNFELEMVSTNMMYGNIIKNNNL